MPTQSIVAKARGIQYVEGELINLIESGEYDVVVHGANCFCTMGAGVAKVLRQRFPSIYRVDLTTVKGDRKKLGTLSLAQVRVEKKRRIMLVNAYTQYAYSSRVKQIDYEAVRRCFAKINSFFTNRALRFLMPKIGAGLAGGDWNKISEIVEQEMKGRDVTVVVWKP